MEEWRSLDFMGFPDYEVSNQGRVRSVDRVVEVERNNGNYQALLEGRILKPSKNNCGYLQIKLSKDRKQKHFKAHRLVVMAFIGDIPEGYQIDHINTIRDDNRLENLRIVTPKENSNNPLTIKHYSEALKGDKNPMYGKHLSEETRRKMSEAMKGEKNPNYGKHRSEETRRRISEAHKKPVAAFTKEGEFVAEFPSIKDAGIRLKCATSNIISCLKGRRKTCKGYKWRHIDEG